MSPRTDQSRCDQQCTAQAGPACAVHGTMLVRLSGPAETAARAEECAQAARDLGQSLILDLTDTTAISESDVDALAAVVRRPESMPAAVVTPDPRIRSVLRRRLGPRAALHPNVAEALTSLALGDPAPAAEPDPDPDSNADLTPGFAAGATAGTSASETVPEQATSRAAVEATPPVAQLRQEIYGLRARARSYGLIDFAQGILAARYGLADPDQAFALLRETSQRYNVPLRVFASALAGAPAPPENGRWFPRRLRLPVPNGPFRARHHAQATDRAAVLQAAVDEAIDLTSADAGTVHLADFARRNILVLEAHRGHGPAYLDAYARLTRPTTAAAKAWAHGRATSALEDALPSAPGEADPLGAGPHTAHATPLSPPVGPRQGALTVQHSRADHRLSREELTEQLKLARDLAAWLSWYRRTVILDALEYLHQRASAPRNRP